MRGINNKLYAIGVLLSIIGGAGVSDATSNVGFMVYAVILSVGFGLCLVGYSR